jgi:hypothetical protein
MASVGTGVDSADAAGGKPSGSHAEQAFIDPVATQVLTVAIRATYLLWAIAGKGNESAEEPICCILWERVRRKSLIDLHISLQMVGQFLWRAGRSNENRRHWIYARFPTCSRRGSPPYSTTERVDLLIMRLDMQLFRASRSFHFLLMWNDHPFHTSYGEVSCTFG